MKKVILLNDTSNDGNWGCKTTSKYLKKLLTGRCNTVYSIPISFESSLKERISGHSKILFIVLRLTFLLKVFKKLFGWYFTNLSWNKKHYKNISESDMVVLNGEGTIHVFNRAVSKWMFYLLVSKYVFDKNYYIVNHTYNIDTKLVKNLTIETYINARKIYTREKISKKIINNELGVSEKNIMVVPDAAFMVEKENHIASDTIQDKYFAICGNVVSSKEAIFNLTSLVIKIQQEFHLTPVFLVADEKDLEFSDALKQSCNELIIIDNATNIDTVLDIIEKSEFFITGRFHPFIFSLTVGAKVITFSSNTHKIEGVKMLINNCVPNINLKDVTTDFLTVSKFYNSYCDSANIQSIETLKSLLPSSYNKLLEDER